MISNQFVYPFCHYMQSKAYAGFMQKLGWEVEIISTRADLVYLYSKKVPLLGSVAKIPRSTVSLPMDLVDQAAKEKKALFVKIEPSATLDKMDALPEGFRKDSPILHTKTILVDLAPIPEKIEKSFKGDVRTCIRKALKENLVVQESNDLGQFYALFEKTAKERGFYHPYKKQMKNLRDAFFSQVKLFLAFQKPLEKHPDPLAGCLVITHNQVAYYKYAASTPAGRKKGASYLCLWKAMVACKKTGCHTFDLEGIADERYPQTRKYSNFTHFKQSWGGKEITYLGSFAKPYSTFYKLLSKIELI